MEHSAGDLDPLRYIDREIAYWNTERLKLQHPLRQLFWECTLRCNLTCLHCGSDCRKDTRSAEMPLEHFLPVLDTIRRHQPGIPTLISTVGGEPLVREDILDCGRAITAKGFYWGMVTNGHLLDAHMMRELLQAGLTTISIDIDGLKDTHNWLRNDPASFDHAYRALETLVRSKQLAWDVITCVHSRNIDQLDQIKKMLEEAGATRWRCFTIVPVGRALHTPGLTLSDDQFTRLMDFIHRTRQEKKINLSYACEGYLGRYEGLVRNHHYSCRAGLTVASVLSDGGISGCLSIRSDYRQGNIYTDDFWDIWTRKFQICRNREWMHKGPCLHCDVFRYCQGNGMHLRDENGDLLRCHYKQLIQK
ncbi:MAG: TIGR04133 family radical SAM/SPASM protein [Coprobacter sp.]|nr:TIGR04133 family radical SAM/SPASM protein [Coprobacter sp.]